MDVSPTDRSLVEKVCEAMQQGAAGEEAMLLLFAEDATLTEPFSGRPLSHAGKPAIRRRYREMTSAERPPDFRLHVDRIDRDGEDVVTEWTCTSVVMPAPLKGQDRYTIRDGKIIRLEIVFRETPASSQG